jgi:CRP/FNR family cyclic AMP-dependent transcriptional regulator
MSINNNTQFDPSMFLNSVGPGRTITNYRAGRVIYSQGDIADAVFYIQDGKVKLSVNSTQGKEAVVALLGPGDFCGEACLGGQIKRVGTATIMADAVIARISKAAMVAAIHRNPSLAEMFIAYTLNRTLRVEADLIDQLFNSSEKRLARLLLLLANFGKEGSPQPIAVKISQETLAEMIGTTRPRVNAFMNKFRKLGFIDYNGGISVNASLLSAVLSEQMDGPDR